MKKIKKFYSSLNTRQKNIIVLGCMGILISLLYPAYEGVVCPAIKGRVNIWKACKAIDGFTFLSNLQEISTESEVISKWISWGTILNEFLIIIVLLVGFCILFRNQASKK